MNSFQTIAESVNNRSEEQERLHKLADDEDSSVRLAVKARLPKDTPALGSTHK